VDTLTCRLLPYAVADGASNMAADEVLLGAAAEGIPTLRLYGWSEATLSLGYFQAASSRLADSRWASLPWVRRPTGGTMLVHHHELTYALTLPPGAGWQPRGSWMARMHAVIRRALESLGMGGKIVAARGESQPHGEVLCFQQIAAGDLLCKGAKVVGSAQRKQRRCLLQHGAILLRHSEHTPQLPGICELAGGELLQENLVAALVTEMTKETGWLIERQDWQSREVQALGELAQRKYRSAIWNEKR
jgi:lipoate-protein ligase A